MTQKLSTILAFLLVGGTAFFLDVGLLELFRRTLLPDPVLARMPGFLIVTLYTWLLNRRYTFRTTNAPTVREYLVYLGGSSIGIVVNWTVFTALVLAVPLCRTYPPIAVFFGTGVAMVFNFLFYSRLFAGGK